MVNVVNPNFGETNLCVSLYYLHLVCLTLCTLALFVLPFDLLGFVVSVCAGLRNTFVSI